MGLLERKLTGATRSRVKLVAAQEESVRVFRATLEEVFASIHDDANAISTEELLAVGVDPHIVEKLDTNGDGRLDAHEFIDFFADHMERTKDEGKTVSLTRETISLATRVLARRYRLEAESTREALVRLDAVAAEATATAAARADDLRACETRALESGDEARAARGRAAIATAQLEDADERVSFLEDDRKKYILEKKAAKKHATAADAALSEARAEIRHLEAAKVTEAARRDSATLAATRRESGTEASGDSGVLALKLMHSDQRVSDLEQELSDATADLIDARAKAAADAEAQGRAYEQRFGEYVESQRAAVERIRLDCAAKLDAAAAANWDPFGLITCSMEADDRSSTILSGDQGDARREPADAENDGGPEEPAAPHEPMVNLVI